MPFTNDLIRERMRQLSNELMTLEVHNGLRQSDGMPEDEITERVEQAKLCASRLIEMAGYDPGDSDRRGMTMDETVMDLLACAFLLIGPDEVNEGVIL
jgi:hypothetical protein